MKPRGHIRPRKRADGTTVYQALLRIRGRQTSLGVHDTERDAEGAIAGALALLGGDTSSTSLLVWGAVWLERRELGKLHRDVAGDRFRWRRYVTLADFAQWPLHRIRRVDVVRWVRQLLRSPVQRGHRHRTDPGRTLARQTVKNALNLLRVCLRDAADEGRCKLNPAEGVRVPKVARTKRTWTYLQPDELRALLDASYHLTKRCGHQRTAFTVAAYTGLRAGELWGLRWRDVTLTGEHPELLVRHSYRQPTKSGEPREVPLLPEALEALQAWRKHAPGVGSALVFPAHGGGCYSPGYDASIGRALARAGVRRVRFHDLRHTCASGLIAGWLAGQPWRLEDVQRMLGHESRTTTERYAHLAPDGIRALAKAAREETTG